VLLNPVISLARFASIANFVIAGECLGYHSFPSKK